MGIQIEEIEEIVFHVIDVEVMNYYRDYMVDIEEVYICTKSIVKRFISFSV